MTAAQFTARHQPKLLKVLEDYLEGHLRHSDASDCAWEIISEWGVSGVAPDSPFAEGERALWGTVWTLQHLADQEHWGQGITQRGLAPYFEILRRGSDLPVDEVAERPTSR